MIRTGALLVLSAALFACSSASPTRQNAGASVTPASAEIAKVVTRDRDISLYATTDGVRATVFDSHERLIVRDIGIDDLQNVDAMSYEATHWSVAGHDHDRTSDPHPVPWRR